MMQVFTVERFEILVKSIIFGQKGHFKHIIIVETIGIVVLI